MKPPGLSNLIELDAARSAQHVQTRAPSFPTGPRARRILAVGGGKGGIGKSMISSNLAIALSQRGSRVVLVDLDLGGANLHTCLGLPQPKFSLSDFVVKRTAHLEQLLVPTGVPNLSLISGANDVLDAADPSHRQQVKLLRSLTTLDVDYLVLDLGAGTHHYVLDFFLLAQHGLLVLLPEPTSIENAYRFVKAAFFRRLEHLQESYEIEEWVEAGRMMQEGAPKTPWEVVQRLARRDPLRAQKLSEELSEFRVKLVVNQVRSAADQTVGAAVVSAWKKFFGLEMDELGAIPYDDEAWRAVRKRRPVLLERPESPASVQLLQIAENLVKLDARFGRFP